MCVIERIYIGLCVSIQGMDMGQNWTTTAFSNCPSKPSCLTIQKLVRDIGGGGAPEYDEACRGSIWASQDPTRPCCNKEALLLQPSSAIELLSHQHLHWAQNSAE